MKLVFVSNYFNHHQKSFCEELYKRLGNGFCFVSTGEMREERKKLGYSQDDHPGYVFDAHNDLQKKEAAIGMIDAADVVIAGSAPEEMLSKRLRAGKLILRYSERPFKTKPSIAGRIYHSIRFKKRDLGDPNVYMLCAGAYAAKDFADMGLYRERMFRWGYFPEFFEYDTGELFAKKQPTEILWCGRFLDWKHPDDAVELARRLRDSGCDYHLNIIGTGVMEGELKQLVESQGLSERVDFLGSMPPEKVRLYMEKSGIYLLTSDRQEGWGAVLNEAMNSGCAVVASHETGSASYMLKHEQNGFIYKSGCIDDLYEKTKTLLATPDLQRRAGEEAYRTIKDTWNATTATDRLLKLIGRILNRDPVRIFDDGPCSLASMNQEDWLVD